MAIQVSGTQVIGNSRELTNIASVDSTTVATLTAAGVGGGAPFAPDFDPSATPDVTLTSTGTWTKPGSLADDSWITIYMVGGGGGGAVHTTWGNGGSGGSAALFSGVAGEFPSGAITFTIGAGGAANDGGGISGGATSAVINSITYTAPAGLGGTGTSASKTSPLGTYSVPFAGKSPFVSPSLEDTRGGYAQAINVGYPSVYGGGGGGGGNGAVNAGGVSTYAGNGGAGGATGDVAGSVPGGGGGGANSGYSSGGGNGSVRIYYG